MKLALLASAAVLVVVVPAVHAKNVSHSEQSKTPAASSTDDWCKDATRESSRDRERVCEVRTLTLTAPKVVDAEAANGSLSVTGTSRRDVQVLARVVADARSTSDATSIAGRVTITTADGRVRADGPRTGRGEGWSVSYRIETPAKQDVRLISSNGSLSVSGIDGTLHLETSNGSLRLTDVAGDVRATTSNGSVQVSLKGSSWSGAGLEVSSSNGSVRLDLPSEYNAHLIARSSNGSINVDRPITLQGRIGRDLDTNLGKGGAPLRVTTSNGSLTVK